MLWLVALAIVDSGVKLVVVTFGWYFDPNTQMVKRMLILMGQCKASPNFQGQPLFQSNKMTVKQ